MPRKSGVNFSDKNQIRKLNKEGVKYEDIARMVQIDVIHVKWVLGEDVQDHKPAPARPTARQVASKRRSKSKKTPTVAPATEVDNSEEEDNGEAVDSTLYPEA